MKITIQNLEFPSELKNKLKIKVNNNKLKIDYMPGNIINLDKTNLSVTEPHRIIVTSENKTLIALVYENANKVYLPYNGAIISFTKYINILNSMIRK